MPLHVKFLSPLSYMFNIETKRNISCEPEIKDETIAYLDVAAKVSVEAPTVHYRCPGVQNLKKMNCFEHVFKVVI